MRGRARLSADDAVTAKSAITTIEAYYLRRDPAIDKASLKKQSIKNKNSAFKMVMQTDKVDLREFCLGSLHDLLGKSRRPRRRQCPGQKRFLIVQCDLLNPVLIEHSLFHGPVRS